MSPESANEHLFDDTSDSSCEEDDEQGHTAQLRVNEAYAKRFEYNSRRAELHRLQEKHPEQAARLLARELEGGDDDIETSSSEEEDEGELSPETEQEWAQALLKIKRKDPSIYDAQTRLFHDSASPDDAQPESDTQDGEADGKSPGAADQGKKQKRKKKKLLREILYEQAVAEGGAAEEEDYDAADTDFERRKRLMSEARTPTAALAYDQEQLTLRDAFVAKGKDAGAAGAGPDASSSDDDEHGGLTVRKHVKKESTAGGTAGGPHEGAAEADLRAYFSAQYKGQDSGVAFLQHYLQQRLWAQNGDDAGESVAGGLGVLGGARDGGAHGMPEDLEDDDDEFLDQADRFEHAYNFRSEEPQGAQIATFPRRIEGLARQEDSRRKRQRESRRARDQEREHQRKEEVKRLKNLKKQQVGDALTQLATVSGKGAPDRTLLQKLLESDFDPAAWDEHMSSAFDEEYYAEAEREDDVTAAAPEIMKEVSTWVGPDEEGGSGGGAFARVHKEVTGKDAGGLLPDTDYAAGQGSHVGGTPEGQASADDDGENGGGDSASDADADEDAELGNHSDEEEEAAEQKAASRDKVHDLLREYYKLDHEDEVGGVKTRFRYREVAPIRDGLSTEEILSLPDSDLNSIIGLRKLAPYREDVTVVRPNYKALAEARQKLVDEGLFIDKSRTSSTGKRPPKASKSSFKAPGVQSGAVGKKTGAWAAANAAAGARAATASRAAPSSKSGGGGGGPAETAGKGEKKKRPGPALRRAMKEASAAQAASGDGGQAADGATEQSPVDKHHTPADLQAKVAYSSIKQGRIAKLGNRAVAGGKRRKTLHGMTEEEKKQSRVASYAGLALPTAPKHGKSKAHALQANKAENRGKAHGAEQAATVDHMTKAAKKNMKRKLKREGRLGKEAATHP